MNADGSNQTRLTNHMEHDAHPTWSHDGSKIAFQSGRDGNHKIYSIDYPGGLITQTTPEKEWDEAPSWSPSTGTIAFTS